MNKVALVLVVAALSLPAVGCGEGSSPGAAGASVAPAATQVFVSVDTSFDSSEWEAGRSLLGKFPDGDRAVDWVLGELGGKGVDFEEDVKPALGPETDFVALDVAGDGKVVGLTQPEDTGKARGASGQERRAPRLPGDRRLGRVLGYRSQPRRVRTAPGRRHSRGRR